MMQSVCRYRISLLGAFEINPIGAKWESPTLRRKTRALLAYLAATEAAHSRRALMDIFCQGANAPARVLTLLLSRIRKQVGRDALIVEADRVCLNSGLFEVDYWEFNRILLADLVLGTEQGLQTAVCLYRNEFLEGLTLPNAPQFELWMLSQRANARQLVERGLTELVQRMINRQAYETAVSYAIHLLQHNSLLEEAHAHLIWLYAQMGQREMALRQYEQCRMLLHTELAVEPTPELQTLFAQIKDGQIRRPFQTSLPTVPTAAPIQPADYLGRNAELAQLQAAWTAAVAGQGGTLLLAGEAGSGKTELIHTFERTLSATIRIGRSFESTAVFPFHPWIEILEPLFTQLDESERCALPPFTREGLHRLLPQFLARPDESAAAVGEGERLLTAVADFLLNIAAKTPLILFLDDLQWADDPTLRLFHYLTLRADGQNLLLIGAYRLEEVEQSPSLQRLLHDLNRLPIQKLQLEPLSTETIIELTAHHWPQLAPGFRPHVAARLAEASGGNAFFVTELLHELSDSDIVPTDLPVPDSVRTLIQRRLHKLPQSSRQLVEALAVLGVAATLPEVQHSSGRSEEETAVAIDHGLQKGLFTISTNKIPHKISFNHDLVRESVLAQISPMRRRLLHRRVATMLAQQAPHLPSPTKQETATRIMHHAIAGEQFSLIFQWAPVVARHAFGLYAYPDALLAYEAAIAAFNQLRLQPNFAAETHEPALIPLLLSQTILTTTRMNSLDSSEALLDKAARLLKKYPNESQQAEYHFRQGVLHQMRGQYAEAYAQMMEAYEQFMTLDDKAMAARSLRIAGQVHLLTGNIQEARQLLEDGLALYQSCGQQDEECDYLTQLGWAAIAVGDISQALHYLTQSLALSEKLEDPIGRSESSYMMAAAWNYFHAAEKVRHYAQYSVDILTQMGSYRERLRPLLFVGDSYRTSGDFDKAHEILTHVFNEADAIELGWIAGWAAQGLGRLALQRGDLDEAETRFHYAYNLRKESGEPQNMVSDMACLGRLYLAKNNPQEALKYTGQAVAWVEAAQGALYIWEMADLYMCHAEVLEVMGEETAVYPQLAQKTLHYLANQISDPKIKADFFTYPTNAHILATM